MEIEQDELFADAEAFQEQFQHVYWIGGGSGAGKSTIARRIADEHDLQLYATDDVMLDHSRRSTPERCPFLHEFMAMDMDERWVNRSPKAMLETFHWFRGEGFSMIREDILRLPKEPGVIAEGRQTLVLRSRAPTIHGKQLRLSFRGPGLSNLSSCQSRPSERTGFSTSVLTRVGNALNRIEDDICEVVMGLDDIQSRIEGMNLDETRIEIENGERETSLCSITGLSMKSEFEARALPALQLARSVLQGAHNKRVTCDETLKARSAEIDEMRTPTEGF